MLKAGIRFAISFERFAANAVKEIVPQPPTCPVRGHRFEFDECFSVVAVGQEVVHHFADGIRYRRFGGHTVGRLTEGFYDTALNEANDA